MMGRRPWNIGLLFLTLKTDAFSTRYHRQLSCHWPSCPSSSALYFGDDERVDITLDDGHDQEARLHVRTSHEDEDDSNNEDDSQGEDEDSENNFSKTKWKKKRYIMMKDVDDSIQRGDAKAVRKAQDMVGRMQRLYEMTQHDEYKPTVQAYNLWINALAKSKERHAGRHAEQVLEEMKRQLVPPNAVSYTSVIDAYARSGEPDAAIQAERVLFALLEQHILVRDESMTVTSITCDAVLNAWALQSSMEAAERAQLILERLEHLQNKQIKPTVHSYSTVMNAYAKCGTGLAAERAEAILNRMLKQATDKDAVRPDTVIFNVVIHAWASSGDPRAGTQAVALLNRMQDLHVTKKYDTAPDAVTYNSVLSAWSHSNHVNAALQTEKILLQMQTAANESPQTAPKPNTVSYNSVLHAWSKSLRPGAAHRAQKVLDYMIHSGNPDICPDVYSFTSVLNAWAKSKEPDKAVRARQLLDTLLELYSSTQRTDLKPSAIPYNTVLNACAFSAMGTTPDDQRTAIKIAVSTFTQLRKDLAPDTVSYGNLLKCCANLMPQGKIRTEMAMQVFGKCCEDGMVGDLVWNEIRRAVPSKTLAPLLTNNNTKGGGGGAAPGSLATRDLPRAWRRNVRDKNANQKKQQEKPQQEKTAEKTGPVSIRPMRNIIEPSYQSGRDV